MYYNNVDLKKKFVAILQNYCSHTNWNYLIIIRLFLKNNRWGKQSCKFIRLKYWMVFSIITMGNFGLLQNFGTYASPCQ